MARRDSKKQALRRKRKRAGAGAARTIRRAGVGAGQTPDDVHFRLGDAAFFAGLEANEAAYKATKKKQHRKSRPRKTTDV